MKSFNLYFYILLVAALLVANNTYAQDCDPDLTAPVATCDAAVQVEAVAGFGALVWAVDINEGSYDACTPVDVFLTTVADDTGSAPTTTSVLLPDTPGNYPVILYVVDESGNENVCWADVNVTGVTEGCTTDEEAPVPICYNGLTAILGQSSGAVTVFAEDFLHSVTDNCTDSPNLSINLLEESTGAPQGAEAIVFTETGLFALEVWARDDFGNAAFCETYIIVEASGECDNDVTTPTAACNAALEVEAIEGFGAQIWAFDFDEGSYDDCSSVDLFITTLDDDTGTVPTTTSVLLPDTPGSYTLVLYVVDESGNHNVCWGDVTVSGVVNSGCTTDEEAPVPICINGLTATLEQPSGMVEVFASDFIASLSDNCDEDPLLSINLADESTGGPQGATSIVFNQPGTYVVEIWARDDFGNSAFCETFIIIEGFANCDDDTTPPNIICLNGLQINTLAGLEQPVWGQDLDAGSFDNCSELDFRIVLAAESDGTLPATSFLTLPPQVGIYEVEVWAVDQAGNANYCTTTVEVADVFYNFQGEVFVDANENCALDTGEESTGPTGWQVRATDLNTGISVTTETLADGQYSLFLNVPDSAPTDILLELILPNGIASGCITSTTLTNHSEPTVETNFAAGLAEDCIYLTTDIATPFLRRCFLNDIVVHYSNLSNIGVANATIEVALDPFLAIQAASLPYTALGGDVYIFEIDSIPPTSSGQFTINATLSCEAELGATHCVSSTITPFTCELTEDFAELIIEGSCDELNEEVRFRVQNVGASGMTAPQEIRIVEDVIMYMNTDPLQLDAGAEEEFTFPANGATWRLEIPQDETYPYGGLAAAFVEGCGGFTPGIATQFVLSNTSPNVDLLCLQNIGSYDPNDKQALPRGFGEAHYIEANTPLEYLIRFQNTGTDTAFNIRIEDQLSEHLDLSSIQPGAASHPYRIDLKEDGLLTFYFDNIMLPDSNVNLEGSNGFVQFTINQLPDNPIGTLIENEAGIYFDFNDPIITNTVWHTIGENFITVKSYEVLTPGLRLTIAPNPVQTYTTISLDGTDQLADFCEVFDSQGRLVTRLLVQQNSLQIRRDQLNQEGLYFFRIVSGTAILAQGKLLAQ